MTRKRILLFIICLPTLFLIGLVVMWFVGQASLASQLAELRAQGLPTNCAEINDFYQVPAGVEDTTDLWTHAIDLVEAAEVGKRGKTLPIIGVDGPPIVPPPGEEWAELDAARQLFVDLAVTMNSVRKAAQAGGQVRFPVDFSMGINAQLPYTQNAREVARLLALDAHVSAHDKKDSQALEDCRGIFAVSDSLRGEPTIISQLVRNAIHAVGCDIVRQLLPHCDWSDADLMTLQASNQAADFRKELTSAFIGERALSLSVLDGMTLGPFRKANKQQALRMYEISLQGLATTWQDSLNRQHELTEELTQLRNSKFNRMTLFGILMMSPALEQCVIAGTRATARQRYMTLAIAVQRFRLQQERFPKSLAEIDEKLRGPAKDPAAQLIDPFDGNPLRYQADEDGFLIYSVGENRVNDGGDVDDVEDRQGRPADLGVRIQR